MKVQTSARISSPTRQLSSSAIPTSDDVEHVRFGGIEVILAKLKLNRDLQWTSRSAPGLWCSIILEGSIGVRENAFGSRTWSAGSSFRHFSETARDIVHVSGPSPELVGVFVHVPPDHDDFEAGAASGGDRHAGARQSAIWNGDPLILSLAWQMMACPLADRSRRLYLSGKALELLSFMSCRRDEIAGPSLQPGRTHEIERLYEARSRLLADLANPPTVPELARGVGLNPRRLGELFKTHFGTSVYAFLKSARLDHAKLLLESGGVTVSQVAYRYGYQPAHFSTEFRRKFGMPPSALNRRSSGGQTSLAAASETRKE